ncbi:MAG: hypothetical protein ACLFVA_00495 [Dehalococcoidia bacterium]
MEVEEAEAVYPCSYFALGATLAPGKISLKSAFDKKEYLRKEPYRGSIPRGSRNR